MNGVTNIKSGAKRTMLNNSSGLNINKLINKKGERVGNKLTMRNQKKRTYGNGI